MGLPFGTWKTHLEENLTFMSSKLLLTASQNSYLRDPIQSSVAASTSEIMALVGGKSASTALPLWSNIGPNADTTIFKPNNNLWANSLRSQLTAVPVWKSGALQQYGGWAITSRHVMGGDHDGLNLPPTVGTRLRFANPFNLNGNGECEIFETEVTHSIRLVGSAGITISRVSDTLPAWVYHLPMQRINKARFHVLSELGMLNVRISQNGSSTNGNSATPNGPKLYIIYPSAHPLFVADSSVQFSSTNEWSHRIYSGDSGTVEMLLKGGTFRVAGSISCANMYEYTAAEINAAIVEADTQAEDLTGHTISVISDI